MLYVVVEILRILRFSAILVQQAVAHVPVVLMVWYNPCHALAIHSKAVRELHAGPCHLMGISSVGPTNTIGSQFKIPGNKHLFWINGSNSWIQ